MTETRIAPRLQRFIDDELLRLPMLSEKLLDAILSALTEGVPSLSRQQRAHDSDLLQKVKTQRTALARRFADSVRTQIETELGASAAKASSAAKPTLALKLELLGDDEVAADVETSQTIQTIKDVAEHELRELATYVSALAGDMDVSRDHNPFGAERFARALWDMARSLQVPRTLQVRLMQCAGTPLAGLLRKSYAASCERLEADGVEPAVYRTLIMPAGARASRPYESWSGVGPDLRTLQSGMPSSPATPATNHVDLDQVIVDADRALRQLPRDAPLTDLVALASTQRERIARHAEQAVDHQLIELLSRLFDAMMADPLIDRDIQVCLSRLQTSLLRLALRDASMLDDYAHPAWRFMDHIAHQASLQPAGSAARAETLRFAEGLIDGLSQEMAPDAERYDWSIERLVTNDQHRLEQRLRGISSEIRMLQTMEDQLAERGESLPTGAGPIAEDQLETIPANLLDDIAPDTTTAERRSRHAWLDTRLPGEWLRIFLNGGWTHAQLLWHGRHGDIWLLADEDGEEIYALRRGALGRLYAEHLATALRPRSLVRAAALRVVEGTSGDTA